MVGVSSSCPSIIMTHVNELMSPGTVNEVGND